jgi:hypothetical protein
MAGGPIYPSSAVPDASGEVFPNVNVGGTNSRRVAGMGVANATLLTANRTWHLIFELPATLPTGTCKLRLLSLANATSGALKFNPTWGSVAVEESYDTITTTAEGTQTVTWASGDNDQWKETKVILDADTPVGGELIYMALVFEDTSTTLAVTSTHLASLIWE